MNQPKMPKAWVAAGVKKPATQVVARIDMSAEVAGAGLCPECRAPMEKMMANGVECNVCDDCRIALPTADDAATASTDDVDGPGIKSQAVFGPSTAESPV